MNRAINSKRQNNKFDYLYFKNCSDPQQYIAKLISRNLKCDSGDIKLLSINELNGLLIGMNIILKTTQLNQLYLFSTQSKPSTHFKNKLSQILYQAKGKLSIKFASEWLTKHLLQQKMFFNSHLRRKLKTESTHAKSKTIDKVNNINSKLNSRINSEFKVKNSLQKLPVIGQRNTSELFAKEIKEVQDIFTIIQKQRQNQGIISLMTNPQDQLQSSTEQAFIPYNAHLYDMNKKISGLRLKAQQKLMKIIKLSQEDNHIRDLIAKVIKKQQPNIIMKNQKYGRFGAMKAYKRMITQQKKEIDRINKCNYSQQMQMKQAVSDIHYQSLKESN